MRTMKSAIRFVRRSVLRAALVGVVVGVVATGCDPGITFTYTNGCGYPIRVDGDVLQPGQRVVYQTVGDDPGRETFVATMPNGAGEVQFPGPAKTFTIAGELCPVRLDDREEASARVVDFVDALNTSDRSLAVRALCDAPGNFYLLGQRYVHWAGDHGRVALDQASFSALSSARTIDFDLVADRLYPVRAVLTLDEFGEQCISQLTTTSDGRLADPPIWPPA